MKPIAFLMAPLLLLPVLGHSQTNGALRSSFTIQAECRIVSTTDVDFGAYAGTQIKRTMSVVARCNKGSTSGNLYIKLDCGENGEVAGNICNRRMKNTNSAFEASRLAYKVYSDSAYTTELNNTGASLPASTANGYEFTTILYPSLTAGQYSATYGNYTDSLNVTITF